MLCIYHVLGHLFNKNLFGRGIAECGLGHSSGLKRRRSGEHHYPGCVVAGGQVGATGERLGQGVCARTSLGCRQEHRDRERGVLKHTAIGFLRYLFGEKRNCLQMT